MTSEPGFLDEGRAWRRGFGADGRPWDWTPPAFCHAVSRAVLSVCSRD